MRTYSRTASQTTWPPSAVLDVLKARLLHNFHGPLQRQGCQAAVGKNYNITSWRQ
ncbi:MAG: hypothetical protein FWG75_03805 [Cystobacterineae bacterium]|nr:hypothetical protein [Cystobacterineae bacterium]